MLPTIINTLKPHPISSKANLQKICQETKIENDSIETCLQLKGKIAAFADLSVENEAFVRKLVGEVSAEYKRNKVQMADETITWENAL